jgi:hypothetical protein
MPQLATIFVCGSSGNFWKSEDSGYSWEQITTGISSYLLCCWGTSSTDVYVGTYGGKIYHYDGSSFTLDYTFSGGSTYYVSDIHGNADGSEIWAAAWIGLNDFKAAKKVGGSWTLYNHPSIGYTPVGSCGGIGFSKNVFVTVNGSSQYKVHDTTTSAILATLSDVTGQPTWLCGVRETSSDVIIYLGAWQPTYTGNAQIYRGDGSVWTKFGPSGYGSTVPFGIPYGHYNGVGNQICVTPTDNIWITAKDHIGFYSNTLSTWTQHPKAGQWRTCHCYDDNNIWFVKIATSSHLVKWNGTSFEDAITVGSFYPTGVYTYLEEDPGMTMFRLRNLKVHDAVETAFATEEGSFSARDVQCVDVAKLDIAQDHLDDPTVVADAISPLYKKILGLKNKTKLSFPVNLRGTGTAAGNATAAVGAAGVTEGQFLKNFFGTETLDTGSTAVASGSDTDTIVTASGAGFTVGNAVLINGEASPIGNKVTNTLTLTKALTATPADSDVVYASATYTPNKTISSLTQQFRAYTGEDDYWKLLGCQLASLKLSNLGPGQLPRMDLEWLVANWTKATGGSLSTPTFLNVATTSPIPGYVSYFHMQTYGTTTKNHLNVSNFSLDFGMDAQQLLTVSGGVQSVQSYVRTKIAPTFEVTFTGWDTTAVAAWANQTKVSILYQLGSTAGNTILIDMRECYIEMQEEANVNSQLGVKVKGYAIGSVPVRLHLL